MKNTLILITLMLIVLSCSMATENKGSDINKSKNKEIEQSLTKEELFDYIKRKLNSTHLIKNVNTDDSLNQKVLSPFMDRNKSLFDNLLSSREIEFVSKSEGISIYIREWMFSDSKTLNSVYEKISAHSYLDKQTKMRFDVIKEPYFVYKDSMTIYVFFVKAEYMRKYLYPFKEVVTNQTNQRP